MFWVLSKILGFAIAFMKEQSISNLFFNRILCINCSAKLLELRFTEIVYFKCWFQKFSRWQRVRDIKKPCYIHVQVDLETSGKFSLLNQHLFKVYEHTSSSTDWNSLSSGDRSMRIVPLPEVFRVKYGLRPIKWNLKVKKYLPKNPPININPKQPPNLSDAYYRF